MFPHPNRLLLNYKQIPYKTTWLHFPDIAPVLAAAGVPPTRSTAPMYTVPALIDGETVKADSHAIAEYIEATYPDQPVSLHSEAGINEAIHSHVVRLMAPLVIPGVPDLLDGRDAEYFFHIQRGVFGVFCSFTLKFELPNDCIRGRTGRIISIFQAGGDVTCPCRRSQQIFPYSRGSEKGLDFRTGWAHICRLRAGGVVFVVEGRGVAGCLGAGEGIE